MLHATLFTFLLNPPVRAEVNEAETVKGGEYVDAISHVKHVLLPITDRNPNLSEGTREVLFLSLLFYVKDTEIIHVFRFIY
jgi:hypothetical protein